MAEQDIEMLTPQPQEPEEPQPQEAEEPQQEDTIQSTLKQIRQKVKEDDSTPTGTLTLRKILGGDILTANFIRHQIWLIVLIVLFTVVYVAFRYQCQQDILAIDKLEKDLLDAKYKALSSSSNLTEKCRESHVLNVLRQNHDSLLHAAGQPPYIINVPEE